MLNKGYANVGKPKVGSIISSIVGAVGGVVSIILGFDVGDMYTGGWEKSVSYGGDAYTGIQNAAAQTANNVQSLAEILKTGMSYGLIIFGVAMIAYFGFKFFKSFENNSAFGELVDKVCDIERHTRGSERKSAVQAKVDSERIERLERLRAQGLITEDEYQQAISKEQ